MSGTRPVLVHTHGSDESDTLLVAPAYFRSQHPRGNHPGVTWGHQASERERVPTGNYHARSSAGTNLQQRDHVIWDQNTDQIRIVGDLNVFDSETIDFRPFTCLVATDAYERSAPAIPQVECP